MLMFCRLSIRPPAGRRTRTDWPTVQLRFRTDCVLLRPSSLLRCVRGLTAAVGEAQPQLQSLRRVLDDDVAEKNGIT